MSRTPSGQVAFVRAGSSIADIPLNHPIYNRDVGGGSLLGIGPYEVFLALDWLGPVERVQTFGQIGPTGIDTFATLQTKHLNGMAQLYCGVGLHGERDALLVGPLGNVTIPSKWWNAVHATIRYVNGCTVELGEPFEFNYEVGHFCDLLRSERTESPILTHDMSSQMMNILDHARIAQSAWCIPKSSRRVFCRIGAERIVEGIGTHRSFRTAIAQNKNQPVVP